MEVLKERHVTHGNFEESSKYVQRHKELMKNTPNWNELKDHEKEALEMVAHKLGRLLYGYHKFDDHMIDTIGYLQRGFL